jgi:hypothetical protein
MLPLCALQRRATSLAREEDMLPGLALPGSRNRIRQCFESEALSISHHDRASAILIVRNRLRERSNQRPRHTSTFAYRTLESQHPSIKRYIEHSHPTFIHLYRVSRLYLEIVALS